MNDTRISRRDVLLSLPALMAAPRLFAQAGSDTIRIRGINHVTIAVSDVKRSVDFYQGLFGMPVISRQGPTVNLQLGRGPNFLGITPAGANPPHIDHLCLGVEDFNADRVMAILARRGVSKGERGVAFDAGGLAGGPMKMRVRTRGPEAGGAREGTPELYIADPNGLVYQLQDQRYCGGGGVLGNVCGAPEPSPKKGLLALSGYSHCTPDVSEPVAAHKFCQDVLGLKIRTYQGPTYPVFDLSGVAFVMFTGIQGAGGGGSTAPRGFLDHACFNMENFKLDAVIKAFESYGIKPRGATRGAAGPMVHYTNLRMAERNGAKEGTPQLHFTDPDGLLMQLQDVSFCGGSGVLGNICP